MSLRHSVKSESMGFPLSATLSPSTSHPDDEVTSLVELARQVKRLPLVVTTIVTDKPGFKAAFERQVRLLQSRSQAFEDGHVTVYDKVLLALTNHGASLSNPAAVAYYCEEFLGVSLAGVDDGSIKDAVAQAVDVRVMLTQSTSHEVIEGSGKPSEEPKKMRTDMVADLAQLWSVYETAKEEYLAVANQGNERTIKAAKFLRDTAENTLHHLQNKNVDDIMLAELKGNYEMAKTVVVSLTGGKKRKFDAVEMEGVRGTPKGPKGPSGQAHGGGGRRGAMDRRQLHPEHHGRPGHGRRIHLKSEAGRAWDTRQDRQWDTASEGQYEQKSQETHDRWGQSHRSRGAEAERDGYQRRYDSYHPDRRHSYL